MFECVYWLQDDTRFVISFEDEVAALHFAAFCKRELSPKVVMVRHTA